jgi:hypothetical protein
VTADPVLTLAWLALAHLVADFVLQTNRIAADKVADGRRGMRGLGWHSLGVAACLAPVAFAFGGPGIAFLVVVSISHAAIDRLKVIWTRRAEAAALSVAHRLHEPPAPAASLGTAWTPAPAALFALDQLAHAAITVGAWALLLADVAPTEAFGGWVSGLVGGWDPAVVHRVTLTTVVILALGIVNIRGASFFVMTLVHPRAAVTGAAEPVAHPVAEPGAGQTFRVRVGPLVATAESAPAPRPREPVRLASPDRVGETIGILERLLIVAFVLTRAEAAIGFVIAAKTLARFRQLDDRSFAEYYLLGTLGSVSVALLSGLLAAAALGV